MRKEIERAGGLKLVYIDPPFDVGADFSVDIEVGSETITKEPSAIEEIAYRDTWGKGRDSYAAMLLERLRLVHSLLAPSGYVFVHVGPKVSHHVACLLDEVFKPRNSINHIVWSYRRWPSTSKNWQTMHDDILVYAKSKDAPDRPFHVEYEAPSDSYLKRFGGKTQILDPDSGTRKITIDEPTKGLPIRDVWEISIIAGSKGERLGYPTQKPEDLLRRVIETCSNEGDLIADFFCGSGTTLAVAEKLGRKWIGCDLGRFAVHTSRKRLIGVQRELKQANQPWRSFEILNLGRYERQYFVGIDPNLPEEQRRTLSLQKEEHYLGLMLAAYRAERVFQTPPFHGRKGAALVMVGPVDAPVTQADVREAVEAARRLRVTQVHALGFEFEMGLAPHAQDEARQKGVNLALKYIPRDVFDRRAVEKGQVVFHDLAYVEAEAKARGRAVTVRLKNFAVHYRQEDLDDLTRDMKNGKSRVAVKNGQVVKISKDKDGIVSEDVLTRKWEDWIDYWAVDFDFTSRPETITVSEPDAGGNMVHRPQWTGGYIFENEWQSFRTRKDRTLELASAPHEYKTKGRYKIAVKVIDIFGNDTTKVIEVTV